MPRFAILEHDHPHLHWDLLLEAGTVAQTWRLAEPPRTGARFEAERIFDHRLLYLDYEGPISGSRGFVVRWDRGTLTWQLQEEKCVVAHLEGGRLRGLLRLEQREGTIWEGYLEGEAPSVPGR